MSLLQKFQQCNYWISVPKLWVPPPAAPFWRERETCEGQHTTHLLPHWTAINSHSITQPTSAFYEFSSKFLCILNFIYICLQRSLTLKPIKDTYYKAHNPAQSLRNPIIHLYSLLETKFAAMRSYRVWRPSSGAVKKSIDAQSS